MFSSIAMTQRTRGEHTALEIPDRDARTAALRSEAPHSSSPSPISTLTESADTSKLDAVSLLSSSVTVPQNVAYRSFPSETVVLNLQTGRYHGLNPTAGRMLDELQRANCVADAATTLAESYKQPRELVERDLCELCQVLFARGLIEIDRGSSG